MSYFASGNNRNTAVANTCAVECRKRFKSSDGIEGEDWFDATDDIQDYSKGIEGKGKGKEGKQKKESG